MDVNLQPILMPVLEGMGTIVGIAASVALTRIAQHYGVKVDAQEQDLFDSALHKALTFGVQQSTQIIKDKGWDHVDVKNAVVAQAAQYAADKFPDAIKAVGATAEANSPKLLDALQRAWPAAAAAAAASPTTPATVAPVASVTNPQS